MANKDIEFFEGLDKLKEQNTFGLTKKVIDHLCAFFVYDPKTDSIKTSDLVR